ncbi:hypothetical protein [Cellulomonas sp. Y8]|uniref:hypothetical protein n=1 Tax=Cellulomonas sp. Y8 TaxID=2591145 RepID=UPI003D7655D7
MPRSGSVSTLGLAVLVALSAGVAGGVWWTRPAEPAALREGHDLTEVRVVPRTLDDTRTVTLVVTTGPARELASPVAGRVSALDCAAGTELAAGKSTIAVDGAGLLTLATAVPPWRDLAVGDTGTDAAALNAELGRLGERAPASDSVTRATVRAYRALARTAGAAVPDGWTIPADRILWLPSDPARVQNCPVGLGDVLAAGDLVLGLDPERGAAVPALPGDALPGDRELLVDGIAVPVDSDGAVVDPRGLTAVLASAAYAEASPGEDGTRHLTVGWALRDPATVSVVPPSSVVGLDSGTACVLDPAGEPHAVSVVGSELGQTFVVPSSDATDVPDRVLVAPPTTARCA